MIRKLVPSVRLEWGLVNARYYITALLLCLSKNPVPPHIYDDDFVNLAVSREAIETSIVMAMRNMYQLLERFTYRWGKEYVFTITKAHEFGFQNWPRTHPFITNYEFADIFLRKLSALEEKEVRRIYPRRRVTGTPVLF